MFGLRKGIKKCHKYLTRFYLSLKISPGQFWSHYFKIKKMIVKVKLEPRNLDLKIGIKTVLKILLKKSAKYSAKLRTLDRFASWLYSGVVSSRLCREVVCQ